MRSETFESVDLNMRTIRNEKSLEKASMFNCLRSGNRELCVVYVAPTTRQPSHPLSLIVRTLKILATIVLPKESFSFDTHALILPS